MPYPARRRFLWGAAAASLAGVPRAMALRSCDERECAVTRHAPFTGVRATNATMFACWAATMEMILRSSGVDIDQRAIVVQTFGGHEAVTHDPRKLVGAVQRVYREPNGARWRVSVRDVHGANGEYLDESRIIRALENEAGLLVATADRMMMLVGLRHVWGKDDILQATAADPTVEGRKSRRLDPGVRLLERAELVPVTRGGQLLFVADIEAAA